MSATHPAAAVWPMLPEPDLRRLADDIGEHGLVHPIILDADGRVLDGRNRLAACQIAGVEPKFDTYDGDPIAFVLSSNNERRHMTLPERAAATALTLATNGHRENGRWARGTVSLNPDLPEANAWRLAMATAGTVLDHAADLLPKVAAGTLALDAAYQQAKKIRDEKERRAELPDDLGVLVDNGELTILDALRRAVLTPRYAVLVAEGRLDLDEAEDLNQRDEREHRAGVQRYVNGLLNFLDGWNTAVNLHRDPNREEVLAALEDYDRQRFLEIEKEIAQ